MRSELLDLAATRASVKHTDDLIRATVTTSDKARRYQLQVRKRFDPDAQRHIKY